MKQKTELDDSSATLNESERRKRQLHFNQNIQGHMSINYFAMKSNYCLFVAE
jgi:hypothetical protein